MNLDAQKILSKLQAEKEKLYADLGADSFEKRMGITSAEKIIREHYGIKQKEKLQGFGMINCSRCGKLYAEEMTNCPKCNQVSDKIIKQSKVNSTDV